MEHAYLPAYLPTSYGTYTRHAPGLCCWAALQSWSHLRWPFSCVLYRLHNPRLICSVQYPWCNKSFCKRHEFVSHGERALALTGMRRICVQNLATIVCDTSWRHIGHKAPAAMIPCAQPRHAHCMQKTRSDLMAPAVWSLPPSHSVSHYRQPTCRSLLALPCRRSIRWRASSFVRSDHHLSLPR